MVWRVVEIRLANLREHRILLLPSQLVDRPKIYIRRAQARTCLQHIASFFALRNPTSLACSFFAFHPVLSAFFRRLFDLDLCLLDVVLALRVLPFHRLLPLLELHASPLFRRSRLRLTQLPLPEVCAESLRSGRRRSSAMANAVCVAVRFSLTILRSAVTASTCSFFVSSKASSRVRCQLTWKQRRRTQGMRAPR
jgi:hypothetical protein